MNINNFTIKTQEILQLAQQIALNHQHQYIDTLHILKSILQINEDIIQIILKKLNVNLQLLESKIDNLLKKLPKSQGNIVQHFSNQVIQLFHDAEIFAKKINDQFISVEHILFALLKRNDTTTSILKEQGINEDHVKKIIETIKIQNGNITSQFTDKIYNALDKYAKNLNKLAREGKLDPVIGREEEIRRVLQILSRRTKNNPILIGEPGVGKTAIAEGLAHRIINGDIPENLKDKEVYSLDISAIIAGAKYKGEFEERLKSIIKEVIQSAGKIILFMDEIHTLVGAGASEGAMDAANILKPALARGELRAIGATTLKEYQKYFEKDKALERRFQQVYVNEPDTQSAIAILRGIKEKYESHHKVHIKDEAIIAAVELSQRYINERFLPDKGIDLIDEAASKLRMAINSKPEELDNLDRKITQLEIQIEAIKRENDQKQLNSLQQELSILNKNRYSLNAQWQGEKELVENIQKSKEKIEVFKFEAEQAERLGDYGKVAELRYGKIKEEEKKVKNLEYELNQKYRDNKMIKEEVTREDIADIISKWTGIPITKMLQNERTKLLKLEEELHNRIIGQNQAIESVANAIRRSKAGLQDEKRPIGSFLFMGPTGVGKTELAKTLAEYLFDDENSMVRIDMSEYQESHSVSRLIGAPPGYIGYDEGGQLTEVIKRRPYAVILFDEIEKAHHDILNILLQILDDGRLTDNKGNTINFKNTIIIMTSNIGAEIIKRNFEQKNNNKLDQVIQQTQYELMTLLKTIFKPEFINRIDEIILFIPLNNEEIKKIVQIQLNYIIKRLHKKHITLTYTPEVIEYLSEQGYDPQFGARPLKRVIQNKVLNNLSKEILQENIKNQNNILLDYFKEKGIIFRLIK